MGGVILLVVEEVQTLADPVKAVDVVENGKANYVVRIGCRRPRDGFVGQLGGLTGGNF